MPLVHLPQFKTKYKVFSSLRNQALDLILRNFCYINMGYFEFNIVSKRFPHEVVYECMQSNYEAIHKFTYYG